MRRRNTLRRESYQARAWNSQLNPYPLRQKNCGRVSLRNCRLGRQIRNLVALRVRAAATQCRSNPVSGRRLPKTGIFQISARDYWRFRSEIVPNWELGDEAQICKKPQLADIYRILEITISSCRTASSDLGGF